MRTIYKSGDNIAIRVRGIPRVNENYQVYIDEHYEYTYRIVKRFLYFFLTKTDSYILSHVELEKL